MAISEGALLKIVASILLPDSSIAQNVFSATIASGTPPYDEDDVVADCLDWMELIYNEWDNLASDQAELNLVQVYVFDVGDQDYDEVGTTPAAVAGLSAGDMLPHGVAAITSARSSNPDSTARKYWAGIVEAQQADGAWSAATLTQLAILADAWTDGDTGVATGATFTPVVQRVSDFAVFILNGIEVINGIPGYQRRRKPGVGI